MSYLHDVAVRVKQVAPEALLQWNPSEKATDPIGLTVIVRLEACARMLDTINRAADMLQSLNQLGRCTYASFTAGTKTLVLSVMFYGIEQQQPVEAAAKGAA